MKGNYFMKGALSFVQHGLKLLIVFCVVYALSSCERPKEDIVLRNIKDVVVDAHDQPTLKANAILYNPNNMRGKLKKADLEIFVNGKKAGDVNQTFNTMIPAKSEFTVPIEVKLAMKELSVMDTFLGMIGGKKLNVHYKGTLRLNYKGVPIKVPIDHKDDIRVKF